MIITKKMKDLYLMDHATCLGTSKVVAGPTMEIPSYPDLSNSPSYHPNYIIGFARVPGLQGISVGVFLRDM